MTIVKTALFQYHSNPWLKRVFQLFCLLIILRFSFLFEANPLLSAFIILVFVVLLLLVLESRIVVYNDSIETHSIRALGLYRNKEVINIVDVETVDYDKPGFFYPSLILGGSAGASKHASLIFAFKNGTYKQWLLPMKKKKQQEMYEVIKGLVEEGE